MGVADTRAALDRLLAAHESFEVVDLSHDLEEQMPVWPTLSRYYHTLWFSIHYGDDATAYQLVMNEHTGTHVDAPGHYMPPGHPEHKWVNEVPAETWMGRAVVIGCRELEPGTTATAEKVRGWEAANGPVRRGDMVIFDFGWAAKWATRPDDTEFVKDWPGLGLDCVGLLLERGVKAVCVDTLSPDVYGTPGDPVHRALLGHGVVIVENLTNLDALPPVCYLVALPLKIKGGTGSPIRAVALVPR